MNLEIESNELDVEIWKIKKIIKNLSEARGNGTSLISLILPPKDQISRTNKMLTEEYGTASNIKSRVNRLSVLSAITSTQQKLKLYKNVPKNGLVIYCGTITNNEGKEKKVNIDFEPFKPIQRSLYICDNRFHTESLKNLLNDNDIFGFIIMDGNGCLYATLQGSNKVILNKFYVDLPKKHSKGGQSAQRFGRIRLEKRHAYLKKCAELSIQNFITDNVINVKGLVLAGSAEFKDDLFSSEWFDQRLQKNVIKKISVSYGMESGLNEAIEQSAESLSNVKLIHEKKIIQKYMGEIAQDTGKYCFMINDTIKALEMSAIDVLIIWENLEINRYVFKNPSTNEQEILFLDKYQEKDTKNFVESKTGVQFEIVEKTNIVEWIAENYKQFGVTLEIVSDKTQEGSQFCRGFGGIGGLLRWKIDFTEMEVNSELEIYDDDDFNYNDDDFL